MYNGNMSYNEYLRSRKGHYLSGISFRRSGSFPSYYRSKCFDEGEGERICIKAEGYNGGKRSHKDVLEAKALAASKNHSDAERRRRERINAHLATLRRLIPSTNKMDKATLLGEVICHVKELKKRAAEAARGAPIPTDFDDLKVESDGGDEKGRTLIRASLCCDDRPDLLADLLQSFQQQRLKTVKAELSTLGGRVKNVFLMTSQDEVNGSNEETESIHSVQEALMGVLNRSASSEFSQGSSSTNKRQRILPLDLSNSYTSNVI